MLGTMCQCILVKNILFITEDSKMDKIIVAGFYCPDDHLRYSWPLGKFSHLFLWMKSMLFWCVAQFAMIRATGVNSFSSAQLARLLFLLCAGKI